MRSDPPIVDDLRTRHLEESRVVRTYVRECRVLETDASGVTLATVAEARHRLRARAEPAATVNLPANGASLSGRLRVDVLTEAIVRVRYAEGDSVPANATPMVVGEFSGAPAVVDVGNESVRLDTGLVRLELGLCPFTVRTHDRDERLLCEIGGRDKNYFSSMGIF